MLFEDYAVEDSAASRGSVDGFLCLTWLSRVLVVSHNRCYHGNLYGALSRWGLPCFSTHNFLSQNVAKFIK